MRTYALLSVALLLSACSGTRDSSHASPSPRATQLALRACERREVVLDGVDMLVQANLDSTVGKVTVLQSPNDAATQRALDDVKKAFGEIKPDTRTQTLPFKQGLVRVVDMCGNPATFSPPSTPSPG